MTAHKNNEKGNHESYITMRCQHVNLTVHSVDYQIPYQSLESKHCELMKFYITK